MSAYNTKSVNQAFYDQISSDDAGMFKNAQQAVNEFTRIKMREDGFWRKIIPPVPVTNDELDRQVDTDKPVVIVDKEIDSPAAISIPFGTLPMNRYIRGSRYRVMFDRITTPRFTKDIDELRTYDMDIRQVLSDNAIKDMLAEEDGKAIATVNALIGAEGSTVALTGTVQNKVISGGLTRENFATSRQVLPSTPNHLEGATILMNNVTAKELEKWGRDEVGGDLAEEIIRNGFAEGKYFGVRLIITIKRSLVADNVFYHFAEPKFLGKFFVLEDTTMAIERKFFLLDFFAYESLGSSIANVAGVARTRFA